MGNASSSSGKHQDDTVDFGALVPQGIYTGPRDWNQAIVTQLIASRKLAPFYRPLEDYEENWDDEQILSARKEPVDPDNPNAESVTRIEATAMNNGQSKSIHGKRPSLAREPQKLEAAIYRGAVECPICFLYYPPNINHSRCCDQAICTECFVQIKRSEPTTTHLVSESAACPYCVQDNFGVVYNPPPWRTGFGSEGHLSPWSESPKGSQQSIEAIPPFPTHKRRQKSFGPDSPEVVTTDQIRPDWEAKLAAVRAAVQRRANRRIIMRQVGDRLIPVGVTSGRVQTLNPDEAASSTTPSESQDNGGSRRTRRRQPQLPAGYEQYLGLGGQDLEELMVMEAMRLSLLEHEEQQKKEEEEKKKKAAATDATKTASAGPSTSSHGASSSLHLPSATSSSGTDVSLKPSSTRNSLSARIGNLSRSSSPTSARRMSDDLSSRWLHSSSSNNGAPPFSTIGAAVSAASSTAGAIITTQAGNNSGDSTPRNDMPTIPAVTVNHSQSNDEGHVEGNGTRIPRSIPQHMDSFASSVVSIDVGNAGPSYDQLSSSPESAIDRQPLLGDESSPTDVSFSKGAVISTESSGEVATL